MSDKNFSRAGKRDSERKFGDAPILGKVSRSPLSAVPGGRRRRSYRKHKSGSARKFTIALSLLLLLALSAFFVRHFRSRLAEARQEDGSANLAGKFQERKTVGLRQLEREEALALVKAAFASTGPETVEDYFILGPSDDPRKAADALRKIAESEGAVTDCEWLGQTFANGIVIGEVATRTGGVDGGKGRIAQLVLGADGKWRIDLDSYLRKCVPDWAEIFSGESESCLVRVVVTPDTYYNGSFSDEGKWQAFTLASADSKDFLYGYAERGSPQGKALLNMFGSGANVRPATLELKSAPDGRTRQFEITGVLAEGWVVGESRYDASF